MEATAVDSKGNTFDLGRRELVKELKTAIGPMAVTKWQLPLPPDITSIRIKLKRIGQETDNIITLADIEVPSNEK